MQQGTHEQLMKQEGIYKRFVDARQQSLNHTSVTLDLDLPALLALQGGLIPVPVSYTHLDVYKRQDIRKLKLSSVSLMMRNRAVFMSPRVSSSCLLYTSRCV